MFQRWNSMMTNPLRLMLFLPFHLKCSYNISDEGINENNFMQHIVKISNENSASF